MRNPQIKIWSPRHQARYSRIWRAIYAHLTFRRHYFLLNYFSSSDRSTGNSDSNSSRTRLPSSCLNHPPTTPLNCCRNGYRFSFPLGVIVHNCHSAARMMRAVKLGCVNVTSEHIRFQITAYICASPEISDVLFHDARCTILSSRGISRNEEERDVGSLHAHRFDILVHTRQAIE